MTDVFIAAKVPLKSPITTSLGEDRPVATADQAETNRFSGNDATAVLDIRNPAEEARAAAIRAPLRVKRNTGSSADVLRALENRHRWLLFAQHCYTCSRSEQGCELGKLCTYGKKTLKHVAQCRRDDCSYPRCGLLRPLLQHSRKCQSSTCAICVPVWNYIQRDLQQLQPQQEPQQRTPEGVRVQSEHRGGSSPPQLQQQRTGAAPEDVPPAFWMPPSAASLGAAAQCTASRREPETAGAGGGGGNASTRPSPPTDSARPGPPSASCAVGGARPGPGGNADGCLINTGPAVQVGGLARAGNGSTLGSGLHGPSVDGKSPAGKPMQELKPQRPNQPPSPLQQQLHKQQEQGQPSQQPSQQPQPQSSQQQQQLFPALGPPPPALASSAPQFLGVASGTFPSYTMSPMYGSGLGMALGGSPSEPSDRQRAGITITATPPQPIPVLSCATMRPQPPVCNPAGPPQLVHSYPPSASLGHFFSHLPQHPHQPPGAAGPGSHWLPLPGMAALQGSTAARGAAAATANGGTGVDSGGGGSGGLLIANGAVTSTNANPPAVAAGLWHSQGPLRAGPVALYGIAPDAVRPSGLGGMVQAGPVQSVERYGHPYTLSGVNGAAAGALAMTAPVLLWPGHHQPTAGAMATAATAATAGATTPPAATAAAAVANAPQGHAAVHLAPPYAVGGPGGARLSGSTPALGVGGGGAAAAAVAAIPSLPAGAAPAMVPSAHHLAPHTLLYGPATLTPGTASSANAPAGGGGGTAQGTADVASVPALWSYLLR